MSFFIEMIKVVCRQLFVPGLIACSVLLCIASFYKVSYNNIPEIAESSSQNDQYWKNYQNNQNSGKNWVADSNSAWKNDAQKFTDTLKTPADTEKLPANFEAVFRRKLPKSGVKKVFLDCGANTGSTYKMFHDIWPGAEEFQMISFEIDRKLMPYHVSFVNHTSVVPMAVAGKDGDMSAFMEAPWTPLNTKSFKGRKWGGGNLFSHDKKVFREQDKVTVPTFDLSAFITRNFNISDFVILKLDIEGAEYDVLDKMMKDGAFRLVDKFYLEFHPWQPNGWSKLGIKEIKRRMQQENIIWEDWEMEYPLITNVEKLHPGVFENLPPESNPCTPLSGGSIKLAIAVGMNAQKAFRLVSTILAHNTTRSINIGLFLYRDFITAYPSLVRQWKNEPRIIIGVRGDSPKPREYFLKYAFEQEHFMMLISTLRQLIEATDFSTKNYLLDFEGNSMLEKVLKKNGMIINEPNVWIPPKDVNNLPPEYFTKENIHKIPRLLQATYDHVKPIVDQWRNLEDPSRVPTIVFNSDFDETWISSGFFLDYFTTDHSVENNMILTNFQRCFD